MEYRDNPSRRRHLAIGAAALAVLVGCAAGPALAASAPATSPGEHRVFATDASSPSSIPPPTYNKRCESTAKSQVAMDRCAASQVAQLDRELTHALSVEATALGRSGVTTTQAKWLAFMTSECTLEARPYSGGTIQPLIYGECERGLLFDRIAEIRSVVNTLPSSSQR